MTRAVLVLLAAVAACGYSSGKLLEAPAAQTELRAMQTRAFDTRDIQQTMRSIIATLQDLGFVIDDADSALGIVSATQFDGGVVRIMVTVKHRGRTQTSVRASAQNGTRAVTDPDAYQRFFVALSKAMFLTAHDVE